jgi:protein-S-isoprenylcysteine O-methyltransferase Ste14
MEPYEVNWRNYYDILEISPMATPREIKVAYRRLARKYHPDRAQDPLASDKMAVINEAYEVLSDQNKRARYDLLFQLRYGSRASRTGTDVHRIPDVHSQEAMEHKPSFEETERKELPWIIPVASFGALFLIGILVSIARNQLGLTAIWLSLLWALFSFGAIFLMRSFIILATGAIKNRKKNKPRSRWGMVGTFLYIGILALVSGFGAFKLLEMLLFEPLAH